MTPISRGIRNAFRNATRSIAIIFIVGIAIGLSLTMLVARQAINTKINTINKSIGNTITINPAGVRGFSGGGNPLSQSQINSLISVKHVESITDYLSDRLNSSNTDLTSSISLGSLGKRFAQNSGSFGNFAGGNFNFSPPVTVIASTNPANLNGTIGGGTFSLKSGTEFPYNTTTDVALVGQDLASKNNLTVGSTFTAYSTTFTVDGIFSTGNTFGNSELMIPLTTLQNLSSQQNNLSSAILTIDNLSNVSSTTSKISSILGSSADVTNSAQSAQNEIAPLNNTKTIALYSLYGSIVAGIIILFMTMLMIVRERKKEIGVVKAIGQSNFKVISQFAIEALTLTLLGSVIGLIIGFSASAPMTKFLVNNNTSTTTSFGLPQQAGGGNIRVRNSALKGFVGGVSNNLNNIHAVVSYSVIFIGIGTAIIIAIISSTIAAIFITNISPAEILRNE